MQCMGAHTHECSAESDVTDSTILQEPPGLWLHQCRKRPGPVAAGRVVMTGSGHTDDDCCRGGGFSVLEKTHKECDT